MSDIRTSLLGGSSSDNNFSINIIDNVTATTLSSNYPTGKYSLVSSLTDSSVDVYAYNSAGNLVGTSSGLTLTTTGEFNKVVILGGTATDLISFFYNQSGFVSAATSNEITAAAAISSISPSFVNTVNTESSVVGSNFALDAAVYFRGTDGVERAADSVTRNSATSLTTTSPDTLPTQYSPYSIIVENPGVSRPIKSNSHILKDAINAAGTNIGWTRPADWIALTAPASNEQKIVGLLGISNDNSNYVALLAQGNYTVDWGDGVTENFTSNTKASHQYTYSSISSTITSDGFKQVLVTVTPQAGQNLTVIDLQQTFTRTNLTTSAQIPWLDIAIAGTNLTTLETIGILLPFLLIPDQLKNQHIVFKVDNIACLYGWENKSMKGDIMASILIRAIHLISFYLGSTVHVYHLPRKSDYESHMVDRMTREKTLSYSDRKLLDSFKFMKAPSVFLDWLKFPTEDWDLSMKLLNHVKTLV